METAKSIREDFLQQNAFDGVDTYTSMAKQYRLLKLILEFHHQAQALIDRGGNLDQLLALPVREDIARAKYIPEEEIAQFDSLMAKIQEQIAGVAVA